MEETKHGLTFEEQTAKDLLESIEVHIADCNAAAMSSIACDDLNIKLILKYAQSIREQYEEKLGNCQIRVNFWVNHWNKRDREANEKDQEIQSIRDEYEKRLEFVNGVNRDRVNDIIRMQEIISSKDQEIERLHDEIKNLKYRIDRLINLKNQTE